MISPPERRGSHASAAFHQPRPRHGSQRRPRRFHIGRRAGRRRVHRSALGHQFRKHRQRRHALGNNQLSQPQLLAPEVDLPARRAVPCRCATSVTVAPGAGFPPQSAPAPLSCVAVAQSDPRSPPAAKLQHRSGRPIGRQVCRLVPSQHFRHSCARRMPQSDHQRQEGSGVALTIV